MSIYFNYASKIQVIKFISKIDFSFIILTTRLPCILYSRFFYPFHALSYMHFILYENCVYTDNNVWWTHLCFFFLFFVQRTQRHKYVKQSVTLTVHSGEKNKPHNGWPGYSQFVYICCLLYALRCEAQETISAVFPFWNNKTFKYPLQNCAHQNKCIST